MNLAPVKPWQSARGLAQSKTLSRCPGALDHAIASWSAPVLWRFTLRVQRFHARIIRRILTPALSSTEEEREKIARGGRFMVRGGTNLCVNSR
ncbi:MAG: hypothetical protein L0Z50_14165 [Verrucomicrobiales bacterium]|nr:hypothetical protein [Verrucomicrobiales bacterium]